MIGRRRMRTGRALVLVSRIAVRRAKARSRRSAWTPISLRWRRTRRTLTNIRAGRVASPPAASSVWFPQFHLHFNARVSDRSRRDERRVFPAAAAIREGRGSVVNRRWTSIRTATLAMQSRRIDRPPRVLQGAITAVPKADVSAPPLRRSPAATVLSVIAAPVAYRSRPAFVEPLRKVMRARKSPIERAQTFETPSPFRWRDVHMIRVHPPVVGEAVPRHSPAITTSQVSRPPELVYRREARTDSVDEPSPAAGTASSSRSAGRSVAAQESAPELSPHSVRAAALRVTDLDPALLDRLTDDVIRRVERRVRIERERRGL
jgi:hypothetical protein